MTSKRTYDSHGEPDDSVRDLIFVNRSTKSISAGSSEIHPLVSVPLSAQTFFRIMHRDFYDRGSRPRRLGTTR
jgi:hypothetical protein